MSIWTMISRSGQVLVGILCGLAPYMVPFVLLVGMVPSSGPAQAFATAFPIILPGLISFTILFGLLGQAIISYLFSRRGRQIAAVSVWLVYPLAGMLFGGTYLYREYRISIAAREDYSSRELPLHRDEVRDLALFNRTWDFGDSYYDDCTELCVATLKAGVLDSFAVPAERDHASFKVYRLHSGKACVAALQDTRPLEKADRQYQRTKATFESLVADLESLSEHSRIGRKTYSGYNLERKLRNMKAAVLEREEKLNTLETLYLDNLKKPRLDDATGTLIRRGHFDWCITFTFIKDHDYDVLIRYGVHVRRPYGPCCDIAEFYENREGAPQFVVRWEAGDGENFFGERFGLAGAISRLTGRSFEPKLQPYPVEDVETELLRLAALLDEGAFVDRFFNNRIHSIGSWLKELFWKAQKGPDRVLRLSAASIESLASIAAKSEGESPEEFLQDFDRYLHPKNIARLRQLAD